MLVSVLVGGMQRVILHTSKASFAVWDDCFGSENPTSNGGAYVVEWKYAILHIQY